MEKKLDSLVNATLFSKEKKSAFKEILMETFRLYENYKSVYVSQDNVSEDVMNDINENFRNITVDYYIILCARDNEADDPDNFHEQDEKVFKLITEIFS